MEPFDWTPYLVSSDTDPWEAFRIWNDAGIGDGLPVIPPTTARVRRMYREGGVDPVRLIAPLEPSMSTATGYDLAVCAVAAGCAPEHLPVLAGAVAAVANPAFNLLGIQTTTGTAAPVVIAHGPAAERAGVSGGVDCLGGSAHANAAIGRALRFVLRSVGGAVAGKMDAATMGQPAKLGLCFAENTAMSPWPPLHTARGFRPDQSAVTVIGVTGSLEVVYSETDHAEDVLATAGGSLLLPGNLGSRGLVGGGSPLVVFSYEHAHMLDRAEFDRERAQSWLWEHVTLPLDALSPRRAARIRTSRIEEGADPDARLRLAIRPEDILIAVAGGIGVKSTVFPSWGGGTQAITVGV